MLFNQVVHKRRFAQKLQNTRGFSLMEVMIAGSIMITMTMAVATMIARHNKSLFNNRAYANRDDIKIALQRAIRTRLAYVVTAGEIEIVNSGTSPAFADATLGVDNGMFHRCLFGDGGAGGCVATINSVGPLNTSRPLYLIPAEMRGNIGTDKAIAGPSGLATRVWYKLNGERCPNGTSGSDECPIGAEASFTATCPSGAVSCVRAEGMSIRYKIVNGATTNAVPAMATMTTEESQSFSPAEILNNGLICTNPATPFYGGMDTTGLPICTAVNPNGDPTALVPARTATCSSGQFATSIGSDGLLGCTTAMAPPNPVCGIDEVVTYRGGGFNCEKRLQGNQDPAVNTNQLSAGRCQAGYVVTRVNANGSVECARPLANNPAGPTANQLSQGVCAAGYIVDQVNADGSVNCRKPATPTCNQQFSGFQQLAVATVHTLSATCSGANETLHAVGAEILDGGVGGGCPGAALQNPSLASFTVTPTSATTGFGRFIRQSIAGLTDVCGRVVILCCTL